MGIDLSTYNSNRNERKESSKFSYKITKLLLYEFNASFSDSDKASFYKEFSTLLKAGVDFRRTLQILEKRQVKKSHKDMFRQVLSDIVKGKTLFESLKDTGEFSSYEYFSVKIGEETRSLEEVMCNLNIFFIGKVQIRKQFISVITYPIFVLILTFFVVYFMLSYVVPMFSKVFRQFGKELPALTKKIIYISEHFGQITSSFVIVVVIVFCVHYKYRNSLKYKLFFSNLLLKIPYVGDFLKNIYMSRLCQSFSLLLSAKTPLINAIELVEKMISFAPLQVSLAKIRHEVRKGVLFSKCLEKYDIFDYKFVSMVSIAEEINDLDNMFKRLSEQYAEETNYKTKVLGSIIEPVLIIVIGIIVGVILIAMYSPMFNLSEILQ